MEKEELRGHIENIIQKTFQTIDNVYRERIGGLVNNDKNRLIFPFYNDGRIVRVSEQELRFIFVDQFIQYCKKNKSFNYFYSIETPTRYCYRCSKDNNDTPRVGRTSDELKNDGISLHSASIDLTIYSKDKKTCVAAIEFKKDGCRALELAKDFLKLSAEPGENMLRYLIMISDSPTLMEQKAKNGKEVGLLDALKNKLSEKCFDFTSTNITDTLKWNDILLRWYRLPTKDIPNCEWFKAIYKISKDKDCRLDITEKKQIK